MSKAELSKAELEERVLKSLIEDDFNYGYEIIKPKILLSKIQHGDGERWGGTNFPNGVFTAAVSANLGGGDLDEKEFAALLFVCADGGTGEVSDVDQWQHAVEYVEVVDGPEIKDLDWEEIKLEEEKGVKALDLLFIYKVTDIF